MTAARMFVTAVLAAGAAAQSAELDDVLARARAYVAALQNQLSGVVVEETYEQFSRNFSPTRPTTASPPLVRRRLKSDLLLVKPQGTERWIQFRDVFEVDGQSVRDRSERLVELFLKPTGSTRSQAERIMTESARFNVGGIERNLNVPLMALMMLMKENAARFRYKRSTKSAPQLIRREADSAWVVEFEETARPTLIHTLGDADVPSRGRFWIDADTGRVLATELIADTRVVSATIDVLYGEGPQPGQLVPIEMRELYEQGRNLRVDGTATYGRFRQFQVSVDEQLAPVKK